MTTHRLPYPAELKRMLQGALPCPPTGGVLHVQVTPRDRGQRKCSAYKADHYELQAFYTTMSSTSLDQLEAALAKLPGVYVATQVCGEKGHNAVTNPAWPTELGTGRRGFRDLRPQVLALIRD